MKSHFSVFLLVRKDGGKTQMFQEILKIFQKLTKYTPQVFA